MTLLGRAAADEEDAAGLLEQLLPLVEQVVATLPNDLDLLTAIAAVIPYPSTALAGANVAVTRRILSLVPPGRHELRARWLSWLGVALGQTGEITQALQAAEEALAIRRELATDYPDRYRPDLAASLHNLCVCFSRLGRPHDALPAAQEAVSLYRELATGYPDRYRPDLAISLNSLGILFSELGRPGEGLPAGEEAVGLYRELASAYPDRYRSSLVTSLRVLANRLEELGCTADADALRREAGA